MKILITEPKDYSRQAIEVYQALASELKLGVFSQEELLNELVDTEVLVLRLGYDISGEVLKHAPRLEFILTPTTGLDHIDLEYCAEKNIEVISLKGEYDFLGSIPSTAEHTWALVLALIRNIVPAANHVSNGQWQRQLFRGNNLAGKKYGILGLGRVGKQVYNYAKAFACEVGYFDVRHIKEMSAQSFSSPEALFEWSDILSIHIPLNPKNKNFISEEMLSHCKKGMLLINTSRGAIWDEQAIAKALQEGKVGGVATDVIANEVNDKKRLQSPLLNLINDKILVTPHIAGATIESMHRTEVFVANKFKKSVES